MRYDGVVYLPVSMGEAIDKLTILDIKRDKIIDLHNHSQQEYDILYAELKLFIMKYDVLYNNMKRVNLRIWDMMEIIRNKYIDTKTYLSICQECTEYNDIRFKVKRKINKISCSLLSEQKSYGVNNLRINVNKNINDDDMFLNIINFLSIKHDNIYIISNFELNSLRGFFSYDKTIIFETTASIETESNVIVVIEDIQYNDIDLYALFNINEEDIRRYNN